MIIPITQTSPFALGAIQSFASGTVHSVYRKTINLSFSGQLIALQALNSPLSPISMITGLTASSMEALQIASGDLVTVQHSVITIHSHSRVCSFDLTDASLCQTHFTPMLSAKDVRTLSLRIREVLSSVNTGGFDIIFNDRLDPASPLPLLAAKERIHNGRQAFLAKDFCTAAKELARLIGLGTGLTPSGDDFLCGLLAGLQIAGLRKHPFTASIQACIQEHLADTIDISAAFLACALVDEFSAAVNILSEMPSQSKIRTHFLEIGHSSGIDTLCGIWFALELSTHI